MNFKVVILTIATFTVGLVELIIGGVLPQIAQDLNVSVSTAGQLIMIYALVYAIATNFVGVDRQNRTKTTVPVVDVYLYSGKSAYLLESELCSPVCIPYHYRCKRVADRDIVTDHCSQSGVQGLSGPCPRCHLHGG